MNAPKRRIDPGLFPFCTPRQREILEKVNELGSMRAAAQALGINKQGPIQALQMAEKKAAIHGYAPHHDLSRPIAPGFQAKGHSTLYKRGEKEPVLQWVKTTRDQEAAAQAMEAAIESLMESVPRAPAIPAPSAPPTGLCTVYTLTDCHVGAKAWGKETGADWDLAIAERTILGAVENLIQRTPEADRCVIAQLGDFLHWDGLTAVTPTSGHSLDADSRFSRVVQVAVQVIRRAVSLALERHQHVTLLIAEGNHDMASSVWLRRMFTMLYENEPRVTVIDSELPYYVLQHGRTMLGWHHGHLKKMQDLPLLMAAQFPAIWGATTRRYVHTGHMHHKHEKEHAGVTIIQHPTIAARDAYAARGGWLADREMTAITYSDRWGQVARTTVCPEMLEAA